MKAYQIVLTLLAISFVAERVYSVISRKIRQRNAAPYHYTPIEGYDYGYPLKPNPEYEKGFRDIDGHSIQTHESKCKSPDYICDGTLKHCSCYE